MVTSVISYGVEVQNLINREASEKVSHYQIMKISYWIVLKPANEIRFIRQNKISTKH